MGQEDERRWQPAFRRLEVMLCDPGRREAERLGADHLLAREAIAFRRPGVVEQAGEEAESS